MSREGSPALIGRLTGVRALIVDANAVSSGILRAQISNWEMTAWVAETPKQAIDLLAQAAARGAPYDVALIDLRLPGMDAEQLAATIRGRADMAKVRLIMLTRRHVDAKHARDSGFDACLVKPVRQTALYDCLVNVMAGRSTEPAPAPVVHKPTFDAPAAMRGEILLVEDNVINQQVALGILQIRGYSVTIANNGREALDMWARHNFDLILMDCAMPEMDGYEATREIRTREQQSGKRVPIVALTANAMAHDRDECLSAGMDDHLAKPFSMQAMQEMLDRWIPASTVAVPRPAERAKRPAKQVLDRQVLDELSKMLGNGKTDMLASLINLYLAESPKLVDELKVAANAGDAREIARVAHSLKSCSANVGAMALSRYCAELLTVAKRGDANEARRMVATLESEYASVQEALSMEFESLSATKEVTSNSRNR
jgi:CheY-like chemotaxis protein/HPt (histidine-containing phosphotransfer) domain-containing protein